MLFFIDESGYEDELTPYKVLAAVSISEKALGTFHLDYIDLKREILDWTDREIFDPKKEIHAHRFLAKQYFTHRNKIEKGQKHIRFVESTVELLTAYDSHTFAIVISKDAPEQSDPHYLRKDYSYLFERFAENIRYLRSCDDRFQNEVAIIIHDSKDIPYSKRLIQQMQEYFSGTGKGISRSEYLCPFPFFSISHLTPFIEIVDLAAYCINWGYRSGPINLKTRKEIEHLGQMFGDLQISIDVMRSGKYVKLYGIHFIDDLRPRSEK